MVSLKTQAMHGPPLDRPSPDPMLLNAAGGLLRSLPGSGRAACAGVALAARGLCTSRWLGHVEPVREESAPEQAEPQRVATPRWLAELGAIRTDWT